MAPGVEAGLRGHVENARPLHRHHVGHLPGEEFFIDNLLVRIHFIIVMIRWTGLAPWEFEFLGGLRASSALSPRRAPARVFNTTDVRK